MLLLNRGKQVDVNNDMLNFYVTLVLLKRFLRQCLHLAKMLFVDWLCKIIYYLSDFCGFSQNYRLL